MKYIVIKVNDLVFTDSTHCYRYLPMSREALG